MKDITTAFDVLIIGGGLAGLSAAIHLKKHNVTVLVVEKNEYPKHKVCGEYISNEVLPYLDYLGIDVFELGAKKIDTFQLSSAKNKNLRANLPLGGFGISRYTLDHALFLKAKSQGVIILQDAVIDVRFLNDEFTLETKLHGVLKSKVVIGAFGKRSALDVKLDRQFIKNRSPYLAVKMHVKGNFSENVVALHNFKGGYCGVSMVENDLINLCYITEFEAFKQFKDVEEFQQKVLFKNHHLKTIFENSTAVFDAPLTISQISFSNKSQVESHIIMCGDTAGMIHPLCGNGMSMAIRSAQLACEALIDFFQDTSISRDQMEQTYQKSWNKAFKTRLKVGHTMAKLFSNNQLSEFLMVLFQNMPFLVPHIIKRTHGKTMIVK